MAWADSCGFFTHWQVLRLREGSVVGDEWEPIEGEFCSLNFLAMEKLDLKWWRAEHVHFPCLEHLKIRQCICLEEIPIEIGDIPTLKVIDVYGSKLARDSAMVILEEQWSLENDELQLLVTQTQL